MSSSVPVTIRPTDCCLPSCTDAVGGSGIPGPQGIPGTNGTNGAAGTNAFTTTTAGFTMPAVAATVNVAVVVSSWASVGQVVYISTAGYFTVTATPDATHITVRNLGYTGNAAPAAVIAGSQTVSPGGLIGATGPAGAGSLNALSPTTTKGDIIVDNGANSPNASDVRLGVGADGRMMTAVSGQPTGLMWQAIIPNATTDNGLPRFDGAAGTPVPLQTSKVVVTDDGAVQASGSGGNARGANAVDLQTVRAAVTQVASGSGSFIGSGANNTASGSRSVAIGGEDNSVTGDSAAIVGGSSNDVSADNAAIVGGSNNTASAQDSFVGGGSNNTASGTSSVIGGGTTNTASNSGAILAGDTNTASGTNSFIGCGANNLASGDYAVANGKDSKANLYGQQSQASGKIAAVGDAQTSSLVMRGTTANNTPTEIFLDGAAQRMTIPSDTTWAFRMLIVARRTDADDESAAYQLLGCIDRNGAIGTTALVGAVSKTVIAEDTAAWDVAATADNVNAALILTVTGENAKAVSWVCKVELTQVTG